MDASLVYQIVDAVCRRMEAKPCTAQAVESCDEIRLLAGDELGDRIINRADRAESNVRRRDDGDVWHIG